jgi:hypothetical protein
VHRLEIHSPIPFRVYTENLLEHICELLLLGFITKEKTRALLSHSALQKQIAHPP